MDGIRAWVAAFAALLLSLLLAPAQAQPSRITDNYISAELLAVGPAVPGEEWMLAIRFSPSGPEWHGYWSNPGDAGLGMDLDWELPDGWTAGDPLYPVPQTLTIAGLMNHVYEGDYAVLVPISVPREAAGDPPPIGLTAEYLACTDRICVPQRAEMRLDPARAARDELFGEWRAAIAPLLDSEGRFELAGGYLRVAIPLPAKLDVGEPHVFIENPDLVDYGAVQTFSRDGNLLITEIPLGRGERPEELRGIIRFGEGQGVRFVAQPGAVPDGGSPLARSARELPSVWIALLGALFGGLLLNIMPCVFPILSLKALALAKVGGDESAARRDALAYTGGVVFACLALGALLLLLRSAGENVGWAFQLQEPWVVFGLLVLAVAITANLAGAFTLPGLVVRGGTGGRSSFATGLLAAFVATPCTGPFMAAAMGAALLLPPTQALALFGALGLGLALPFLLLGFVPALRRMLPKPGPWMERFRKWMAMPMGLTALALVWLLSRMGGPSFALGATIIAGAAVLLLAGVAGGLRVANSRWIAAGLATFLLIGSAVGVKYSFTPRVVEEADSILEPVPFSDAELAVARAQGRPVFMWFTADWCVTCKLNESVAIEREGTRHAFEEAGVIAMRGDWTRRDEEITRFLTRQGVAGVPLYLWYPAGGKPQKLPQVLTPQLLETLPRSTSQRAPPPTSGTAR
ncbi:MAG: protein-disulfide reductase DsbD family protein [Qipengyuania sp.]